MSHAVRYAARTPEQLRNRELAGHVGRRLGRRRSSRVYETDPDVVAAVLPAAARRRGPTPLVQVTIATRRHRPPGLPPFGAGTFAVQARHEGTDG